MEQKVIVDPRMKGSIKDALVQFLYEPVERAFKRQLDEIIVANTLAGKYAVKSFHYKGLQYTSEPGIPPRSWNKLLPHLKARMDEYLAEVKDIDERERPIIFGFINQVLNASNHLADYYALFPDSAHQPIRALKLDTDLMYAYPLIAKDKMDRILEQNKPAIELMKARMVTNLLL
jgi:hypothetical protein